MDQAADVKCTLEVQDMQHKLFLGIIAQHQPVVSCTISNWLRKIKQQELTYRTTKDTPQGHQQSQGGGVKNSNKSYKYQLGHCWNIEEILQ